MDTLYGQLLQETEDALETHGIWILSTSLDDSVSSRPMSIVHIGLDIYFQSNRRYEKHAQMTGNPYVALCHDNISIEGLAEVIGGWNAPDIVPVKALYRSKHPRSYASYAALDGQLVYRVRPTRVKLWKYVDGVPQREILWIPEQRAERLGVL